VELPPDFRDLLVEFAREGAEAILVGGWAVAFHGHPRTTKDIDLVLEGSSENLARASRALARFGAPANVVAAVAVMREDEVVYLGAPPLRIDLLRSIDGVDPQTLFAGAVEAVLDGVRLRVISVEHLIANKRAAGRQQDLVDVEKLEGQPRAPSE
jgi:predicted nucleotidyltransferase